MSEDLMGCVSTLVEAGLTEEEVGRWLTNRKAYTESGGESKLVGVDAPALVINGFYWHGTPGGDVYWSGVYERLKKK